MDIDLREIARRAVGRVLAERGRAQHPVAHPARESTSGMFVTVQPPAPPRDERRPGRALITAESLATTLDGGSFAVPEDAVITALAEDEAMRRGIRWTRSGGGDRRSVAVGADHGGFALKCEVLTWLTALGYRAIDFGTRDENPVDYPDFARAVAEAVAGGQCEFGVVIDGAGIGSAIAANKVPGARAATCCDVAMAKNAREHNFANVVSLGAKMLSRDAARDILAAFVSTGTGEERHRRRVEKITEIERRYARSPTART